MTLGSIPTTAPDTSTAAVRAWVRVRWEIALVAASGVARPVEVAEAFAPVLTWWHTAPLAHQIAVLRDGRLSFNTAERLLSSADGAVFEDPWVRRRALSEHWALAVNHPGFDLSRWASEVVASSGLLGSSIRMTTPELLAVVRRALDALPRGTFPLTALQLGDWAIYDEAEPLIPPEPVALPAVGPDGAPSDALTAHAIAKAGTHAVYRLLDYMRRAWRDQAWDPAMPTAVGLLVRLPVGPAGRVLVLKGLNGFLARLTAGPIWEIGAELEALAQELFPTPAAASAFALTHNVQPLNLLGVLATTRWIRHQPALARSLESAGATAQLTLPHRATSRAEFVEQWTFLCKMRPSYAAWLALEDGGVPGVLPWLVAEDLSPLFGSSDETIRHQALRALGAVLCAVDAAPGAGHMDSPRTPPDDVAPAGESLPTRTRGPVW